MTDILYFTAIFLLEFLLFYFLPTINGEGTLFGFVVHEADSAEVLRKYRLGLVIAVLLSLSLTVGGFFYLPQSIVLIYIVSALVSGWWLHTNFLRSWKMQKTETFSRFVVTLKPRRLINFTNFGWEAAIILLTAAPVGVLTHFYPQLPEIIPVHWGAGGEPDRWAAKSVLSVFFLSFLGIYLQVLLLIVKGDVVQARLRVAAENGERILPLKEMSHRANINLLDWGRLMVGVLFGAVNLMLLSVLANPLMTTITNIFIWLAIVLLLVGIGFYGYQITFAARRIKEMTGQIVFQTAEEKAGWKNGIFYSNPDDAAFSVEKQSGGGYTFNLAHKRTYLYAVMFGFLLIAPVIALIFI